MRLLQLLTEHNDQGIDFDDIAQVVIGMGNDSQSLIDLESEYLDNGGDSNSDEFLAFASHRLAEEAEQHYHHITSRIKRVGGGYAVYRAISAPMDWVSSGAYRRKNLGIYWSYEESGAQVYWGDPHEGNITFIIGGIVAPRSIDWYETLVAALSYGSEEQEIRLYRGAEIDVVSITQDGDDENLLSSREMLTASRDDTTTVYHVTPTKNIKSIYAKGIQPAIGSNSMALGETEPAVHVFLDTDTLDDAVCNWDMEWGGEISMIVVDIPSDWLEIGPDGLGVVYNTIPPSMIKDIKHNI